MPPCLSHECLFESLVWTMLSVVKAKQISYLLTRGGVKDTRLEAKAKDTKKFRGQGQGQTLSRQGQGPRTQVQVFSKKKVFKIFFRRSQKKGLQNFFSGKKGLQKFFSGDFHLRKRKKGLRKFSARFLALSNKISTVQKKCCPRAEDRAIFEDLRPRSRPRTSKSVLEAKDVLEDSTSVTYVPEVESRTQGSRLRPRTQKNPKPRPRTALPRTDPLEANDRNALGQSQGPRTQTQVFSKKKEVFKKLF